MLIGVISDTHDNLTSIDKAFEIFLKHEVSLVVHCGDWTVPATVEYLGQKAFEANISVKAVLGNVDQNQVGNAQAILKVSSQLPEAVEFPTSEDYLSFGVDNHQFAIYHGQDLSILEGLIDSGEFKAIFTGHTHIPKRQEFQNTIVLNPGAACFIQAGQIVDTATVALFDTQTATSQIIEFKAF